MTSEIANFCHKQQTKIKKNSNLAIIIFLVISCIYFGVFDVTAVDIYVSDEGSKDNSFKCNTPVISCQSLEQEYPRSILSSSTKNVRIILTNQYTPTKYINIGVEGSIRGFTSIKSRQLMIINSDTFIIFEGSVFFHSIIFYTNSSKEYDNFIYQVGENSSLSISDCNITGLPINMSFIYKPCNGKLIIDGLTISTEVIYQLNFFYLWYDNISFNNLIFSKSSSIYGSTFFDLNNGSSNISNIIANSSSEFGYNVIRISNSNTSISNISIYGNVEINHYEFIDCSSCNVTISNISIYGETRISGNRIIYCRSSNVTINNMKIFEKCQMSGHNIISQQYGNMTINNLQISGLLLRLNKLIQSEESNFQINNMSINQLIKANGNLIKQDSGSLIIKGSLFKNVYLQTKNMIRINNATTIITNCSFTQIILEVGSLLYKSQSGDLNISKCTFSNIERTKYGNGSVLNINLINSSGLYITETSTFTNCRVSSKFNNNNNISVGGVIYIDILNGGELKYDLSGALYSKCDALYGKYLFIRANDLLIAFPEQSISKLGKYNSKEFDIRNMMGYDQTIPYIPIPIHYLYTPVARDVFHVNNNNNNNSYYHQTGNDNKFCGHYLFPCLSIIFVLNQSQIRNNNSQLNESIIGIINGYRIDQLLTIPSVSQKIIIQNSLDPSNNPTETLSDLKFTNTGKLIVNNGNIIFKYVNFIIKSDHNGYQIEDQELLQKKTNENKFELPKLLIEKQKLNDNYIIQGSSEQSSITFKYCQIHLHSSLQTNEQTTFPENQEDFSSLLKYHQYNERLINTPETIKSINSGERTISESNIDINRELLELIAKSDYLFQMDQIENERLKRIQDEQERNEIMRMLNEDQQQNRKEDQYKEYRERVKQHPMGNEKEKQIQIAEENWRAKEILFPDEYGNVRQIQYLMDNVRQQDIQLSYQNEKAQQYQIPEERDKPTLGGAFAVFIVVAILAIVVIIVFS